MPPHQTGRYETRSVAQPIQLDSSGSRALARDGRIDLWNAGSRTVVGTNRPTQSTDRKSVVSGKSVSVRVDLGGRRIIQKKTTTQKHHSTPYALTIKKNLRHHTQTLK